MDAEIRLDVRLLELRFQALREPADHGHVLLLDEVLPFLAVKLHEPPDPDSQVLMDLMLSQVLPEHGLVASVLLSEGLQLVHGGRHLRKEGGEDKQTEENHAYIDGPLCQILGKNLHGRRRHLCCSPVES